MTNFGALLVLLVLCNIHSKLAVLLPNEATAQAQAAVVHTEGFSDLTIPVEVEVDGKTTSLRFDSKEEDFDHLHNAVGQVCASQRFPSHVCDDLHKVIDVAVSRYFEDRRKFQVRNSDERNAETVQLEKDNLGKTQEIMSSFEPAIQSTTRIVAEYFTASSTTRPKTNARVCFIHSCSLPGLDNSILTSLLNPIFDFGLNESLEAIWVLNYGEAIPAKVTSAYPPLVHWLQVSNDTNGFEVPTLMSLQRIAAMTEAFAADTQILYLHTKGVSYASTQRTLHIEAWSRMMLYFLVERHQDCFYLLRSRFYNIVGADYSSQFRLVSGNFWWTTAGYLRTTTQLTNRSNKYSAETLIMTGHDPQIYVPFATDAYIVDFRIDRSMYELGSQDAVEIAGGGDRCPDGQGFDETNRLWDKLTYMENNFCVAWITNDT